MDKILIKDLEIYGFHGVYEAEKNIGQRFLISVEISIDLYKAAIKDDLSSTINYASLCNEIELEFNRNKYDLIETCAEKLCEYILINYTIAEKVKITIKKPWAPIGKSIDYVAVEFERSWHTVYIGLGSNIGSKEENIKQAIEIIENSISNKVIRTSDLYETKPIGYEEQDNFINAAIEIKTLFTPSILINFLMNTEKQMKRERTIKWGPRTIDLDILLYDDIISSEESAVIPHPRMHERMFVLKPLSDIAPYVVHPILNKRIVELLQELSINQKLI